MPLSLNQLKELLEKPVNRTAIRTADAHEQRVRLHVETTLTHGQNAAITEFVKWVESLIPEYKAFLFKTLFRLPSRSVSISDKIFEALEKLFDGRDVTRTIALSDSALEDDQKAFFKKMRFLDKWRFESFQNFRYAFNSFIICDLPAEQVTDRPEPFFTFLPIDRVKDFDATVDEVKWILYQIDDEHYGFIDREAYQVIKLKDGLPSSIESVAPHDLGRCPVSFFMRTPISSKQPFQKRSPISPELSGFDWYLFHAISKMHLDMYASYPIYWGYAQDCDYEDPINDLKCDGGFLVKGDQSNFLVDRTSGGLRRCPVCHNSRLNGAGSYNEIPAPEDRDTPDVAPPVGIVSVDDRALKYNVDEHARLKLELYANITGFSGELNTEQAVNETQVMAAFDSRANILKVYKKEFEDAEQWVIRTLLELRYGPENVIEVLSDYGTEFYIYSPQEILDMYTKSKAAGHSDQILTFLQDQYYETKHRNNPSRLQRVKILTAVEPYRHLTKVEAKELFVEGLIPWEKFYVKLNFASLIDRFELDNGNLLKFGINVSFEEKVRTILKSLIAYAKEEKVNDQPSIPESSTT